MGVLFTILLFSIISCVQVDPATDNYGDSQKAEVRAAFFASNQAHKWYSFTENEITEVTMPQNAPIIQTTAWTESIRVASSATDSHNGYFLVNRLGLIQLPDSHDKKVKIFRDKTIFNDKTANSLVLVKGEPFFSTYRNSFFNFNRGTENGDFLLRFDPAQKVFSGVLSATDLEIPTYSEAIDVLYDGNEWTCVFKRIINDRADFDFVRFSTNAPLSKLQNKAKIGQLKKRFVAEDFYQNAISPRDFSIAPDAAKKIFRDLQDTIPFLLTVRTSDGSSPIYYTNDFLTTDHFEANLFLGTDYSIAVFSDGTAYFSGKIAGSDVTKPFRLPQLPAGFQYGDIALCGRMLFVSWEENFFFETRRSGFLSVDLEKVLL
ncbi:MAG: hypothetical protein IIW10_04575 [Spirochaetaceae bacterium]|nr:hypothetical protein [Spirochaetaceae bacterium]